jgi:hypothetical protein
VPSVSLGDFDITSIRDGAYWWDGGAMFGVVPRTLWRRRAAPDEPNRIPLAFNCYLIRTGEHTILIETGGGDKMDARARERMKLPPEPSRLPDAIARQGIDPKSIDIVINRDGFPGHADAIAGLVPRHMVGDHAEERGQRVGTATSARPEKI